MMIILAACVMFQVFILHREVCTSLTTAILIPEILAKLLTILMVLYSALLIMSAAVIRTLDLGSGTYQIEH